MPKLNRSEWYDLTRDMNWTFRYVEEEQVFPEALSNGRGIPAEEWWRWDEPYKISYREYVHNQSEKDESAYSINAAIGRSNHFENLDAGWKSGILAHYGAIAIPEYLASIGESRMGRFGRAAAWRNMATYGTLDEMRHSQIQTYFPHTLLDKEARMDWAHKAFHTNEWGAIAARSLFDDMITANDAVSMALQLTFTFETGFTNLQFLGMAADAMKVGDVDFGALISSIQTDEARHAQQGEPTLRILLANGQKEEAQRLIDHMFWRAWHVFALLTGLSMDYYTPLEHRSHSFKEFMNEFIVKQFMEQFRDFGMDLPWYWEQFLEEMDWYHHALHLGVWFWRPTVWWNPDAGMSVEERDWLEEKYPGWNDTFGKWWDVITENVRSGNVDRTLPETFPMVCNMCHIPVCTPAGHVTGHFASPAPLLVDYEGRRYTFCSEPCKWVFESDPKRFAGHKSLIDRFLGGEVQPPTVEGALRYMGLSPAECGTDADDYAWAFPGGAAGEIRRAV
ncbi:aromatic/alkene/methane monooxygenase hydroxylase/oxygenase subunit alpha [Pseudonocardia benzenivorans]|uniref:propane 2-monooxygenase n=1 Tax=Pseudonocardia benzenivorans TaxID=228005 RepID=A0ABW3V952_9PSEU